MENEKIESIRRGITDATRELEMARSKGWEEIADDWASMRKLLTLRLDCETMNPRD